MIMSSEEEQLLKQKNEDFKKLILELHRTNSLFISRVPKQVKAEFIQFAHDDFEGDYGMCLKYLWDVYVGLLPPKDAQLVAKLDELNERISILEGKGEPSKKVVRLGDGRIIEKVR